MHTYTDRDFLDTWSIADINSEISCWVKPIADGLHVNPHIWGEFPTAYLRGYHSDWSYGSAKLRWIDKLAHKLEVFELKSDAVFTSTYEVSMGKALCTLISTNWEQLPIARMLYPNSIFWKCSKPNLNRMFTHAITNAFRKQEMCVDKIVKLVSVCESHPGLIDITSGTDELSDLLLEKYL